MKVGDKYLWIELALRSLVAGVIFISMARVNTISLLHHNPSDQPMYIFYAIGAGATLFLLSKQVFKARSLGAFVQYASLCGFMASWVWLLCRVE